LTQVKNRVGLYIYQWHGRLLPIKMRPAMTGFVQISMRWRENFAELMNICIKRGAVLAEVGNEGGSLGLEGGAYAALRAVRAYIAKGEDFSEPPCVSSNVFNECAFRRNQLAITENSA